MKGVPGVEPVVSCPSPVAHVSRTGKALAVATQPRSSTRAVTGAFQLPHSHVVRPVTPGCVDVPGGLTYGPGRGSGTRCQTSCADGGTGGAASPARSHRCTKATLTPG